jgi:hypothetical protein
VGWGTTRIAKQGSADQARKPTVSHLSFVKQKYW